MPTAEKISDKVHANPLTMAFLLDILTTSPASYAELEEATGWKRQTLCRWMAPMRKASPDRRKLIRIAGWDLDPRGVACIPMFEFAPGKRDVPMPRITNAERARRYRAKQKAIRLNAILASKENP